MARKHPILVRRACGWFLVIVCHAELPLAVGFQRPVAFQARQQQQQQQQHQRQQPWLAATKEKVPVPSAKKRKISQVSVGELVGSGSYGTVHILNATLVADDNNDKEKIQYLTLIGKRPWTAEDLLSSESSEEQGAKMKTTSQERATRCSYYWSVEEHCFSKLPPHPQLPPYFGTNGDWMLFGLVGDDGTKTTTATIAPAPTLSDLMKLDQDHPQDLTHIAAALGCDSYPATLDRILQSLLTVLDHVHQNQIVHRDVKPSNVLVQNGTLILMDFGSAADLEPSGNGILKRRRGLEDGSRVAVSPIYCAPEIFVEANYHPTKFDIFSTGLLMCQLVFAYLDERTDAGFHQQFKEVDWDLNLWLSNELAGKVRPQGLPHALEYLGDRPGLWTLLQDMLSKDPGDRPSASEALQRLGAISKGKGPEDGPFFTMVIESMDTCDIPTMSQPLQFVATFALGKSLGLVLSEMDDNVDDADEDDDMDDTVDEASKLRWKTATSRAVEGEVFIKEIVQGGQADELGILEIGDRLQGVGEFPFYDGGFERAVKMLKDQPRNAKTLRLHFDRISVRSNEAISMVPTADVAIRVVDHGAWSFKGRRTAQEDKFVLHEIHDARNRSVFLAGVMDGHGGMAASTMVSETLPTVLSRELLLNDSIPSVEVALKHAWEEVCQMYRKQCSEDSCAADYDPKEGILMANTGSDDLIAGTTATMFGLDETTGSLTVLNCGDSRTIMVESGKVTFATKDHTPQVEQERLMKGIEAGLDYSLPQCRVGRWYLPVGEYEYALCRALEGPFATSKGIVSDPDLTTFKAQAGMTLMSASDGLWDVMDNSEVAKYLTQARELRQMTARDAARKLANRAIEKGTADNVSVVVVYL